MCIYIYIIWERESCENITTNSEQIHIRKLKINKSNIFGYWVSLYLPKLFKLFCTRLMGFPTSKQAVTAPVWKITHVDFPTRSRRMITSWKEGNIILRIQSSCCPRGDKKNIRLEKPKVAERKLTHHPLVRKKIRCRGSRGPEMMQGEEGFWACHLTTGTLQQGLWTSCIGCAENWPSHHEQSQRHEMGSISCYSFEFAGLGACRN